MPISHHSNSSIYSRPLSLVQGTPWKATAPANPSWRSPSVTYKKEHGRVHDSAITHFICADTCKIMGEGYQSCLFRINFFSSVSLICVQKKGSIQITFNQKRKALKDETNTQLFSVLRLLHNYEKLFLWILHPK